MPKHQLSLNSIFFLLASDCDMIRLEFPMQGWIPHCHLSCQGELDGRTWSMSSLGQALKSRREGERG